MAPLLKQRFLRRCGAGVVGSKGQPGAGDGKAPAGRGGAWGRTLPQEVKGARVVELHRLADVDAVQLVVVHQDVVLCRGREGGGGSGGRGGEGGWDGRADVR